MPIIAPPSDNKVYEPEEEIPVHHSWEQYRRVQILVNVNNWICPACSSTVFGRCKRCPYCLGRRGGIVTERPKDFVLRRTNVK